MKPRDITEDKYPYVALSSRVRDVVLLDGNHGFALSILASSRRGGSAFFE